MTRSECADTLQPGLGRSKLGFEREVDEVAGDRDVIRLLRLHVRHQRIEHAAGMELVAVARPVEIAERTFAGELAKPQRGQRRQMRIGQMGQRESRHHMDPKGSPMG